MKRDFSTADSRPAVIALVESGELAPLLLLPETFGGDDRPENVVFVPPAIAVEKRRIDENIVLPLVSSGSVTRYAATPHYRGDSFVPTRIELRATDPGNFCAIVDIWGDEGQSSGG